MEPVNEITVKRTISRTLAYYILIIITLLANLSVDSSNVVFSFTFATLIITLYLFVSLLSEWRKLK